MAEKERANKVHKMPPSAAEQGHFVGREAVEGGHQRIELLLGFGRVGGRG